MYRICAIIKCSEEGSATDYKKAYLTISHEKMLEVMSDDPKKSSDLKMWATDSSESEVNWETRYEHRFQWETRRKFAASNSYIYAEIHSDIGWLPADVFYLITGMPEPVT